MSTIYTNEEAKNMRVLHLTIKKKWFDMISTGQKLEEYRDIKPHWIKRLVYIEYPKEAPDDHKNLADDMFFDYENGHDFNQILKGYFSKLKSFDAVTLINGYATDASRLTLEIKGIEIGTAKPEWSDNWQGNVFVIKLGKIINKTL